MCDLLNFSFWPDDPAKPFAITLHGTKYTGYWTLPALLQRCEEESDGHPLHDYAHNLLLKGGRDWAHVFRGDDPAVEIPLLGDRIAVLKQASECLVGKWGGSFLNCLQWTQFDVVVALNLLIREFPSFRDRALYHGHEGKNENWAF